MDKQKLPNNIKSIIIAMDDELHEEFNKLTFIKNGIIVEDKKINAFIDLVSTLLKYYFNALYERINKNKPNAAIINQYDLRINSFINDLTTALYHNLYVEVYDELFERIVIFIINLFLDLQVEKLDKNVPVYITPITNHSRLINNVYELSLFKSKIDVLNSSFIFANRFEDFTLNQVKFKNVPVGLKPFILQILNKIDKWLTPKTISFTNFDDELIESNNNQINYKIGLWNLQYNVAYTLIKDKMLKLCDQSFWQEQFNQVTSNLFVADECIHPSSYLYHMRAEIDYEEYFLSCVIAYLFDEDQLKVIDYIAFKRLCTMI